MCGIFGIVYYGKLPPSFNLKNDIVDTTIKLLAKSSSRGRDASGVCVVADKITMYKNNVSGINLCNDRNLTELLKNIRSNTNFRCVIGHTRAQTKGCASNNLNNHPIKVGNVIGVHNGMIWNDDILFKKFINDRIAQVDSEIIFSLINKYINKDMELSGAIKETFMNLMGSYACAVVNSKYKNKLALFRHGSPIYLQSFKELDVFMFASTEYIAKDAIEGNIQMTLRNITTSGQLPNDSYMIIDMENKNREFSIVKQLGDR